MPPFTARPYEIAGLLILESVRFNDSRGFFNESFREDDAEAAGIPRFVQDNVSRSSKGTLRGLHYQKNPKSQGKLLRCVRGKIFDVAVDLRKGSPSFGKWAALELSDEDNRMLWVPAGFAHGFLTLSDTADVLYKVTQYYSAGEDRGISWNDPKIGIKWPGMNVFLSPKDAQHPPLEEADNNFVWDPRP